MCSVDCRRSSLAQPRRCSHSLASSSAAYGCGSTNSCVTCPTKHAAVMKTKSTIRGALSRLRGFLNPKQSPCAGPPSFSAYFCRRSTTRISFSQRSASWPPHSHTTSWVHRAPSSEKHFVPPQDMRLSKLALLQSSVCYVTSDRESFFSLGGF